MNWRALASTETPEGVRHVEVGSTISVWDWIPDVWLATAEGPRCGLMAGAQLKLVTWNGGRSHALNLHSAGPNPTRFTLQEMRKGTVEH